MKGKVKQRKQKQQKSAGEDNSRKVLRKQKRLIKKSNRRQHYMKVVPKNEPKYEIGRFVKRPADTDNSIDESHKEKKQKRTLTAQDLAEEERERELKKEKKLQKEMEKQRHSMLLQANEEEDKLIKKLEKQLGLSKVKNKKNLFTDDGLDYLLEVCDQSTQEQLVAAEKHLANIENESDFEEDIATVTGKEIKKDVKESKKNKNDAMVELNENKTDSENDEFNDDIDDLEDFSDNEDATESEDSNKGKRNNKAQEKVKIPTTSKNIDKKKPILCDNQSDFDLDSPEESDEDFESEHDESENEDKNQKKSDVWEDIYGRKRDKEGNVIKEEKGAYIPPHLRNTDSDSQSKEMLQLKRQIKGVLNKLAGTNLHYCCTTIENLYNTNSRHSVNTALTDLWTEALVQSAVTPDRMLAEHAAFVSILQANVGTEVGAHFLQVLVKKFNAMTNQQQSYEGKQLDNLTAALAFLYSFKIYEASLLYELLTRLLSHIEGDEGERRVACVITALRAAGGTLRKDKPLALKDFIQETQATLAKATGQAATGTRIKYLLEVLMAVKNNNLTKIPNYEPTYSEHLKKMTKGIIRRGNYVTTLNISLEDLLKADERGKWWVVGSAWEGDKKRDKVTMIEQDKKLNASSENTKLLELARKQRMNTDIRRNIFCIIMSAQDYMDAFEKLQQLGLKHQQEREIIHIVLACCLQEKTYNPYYAVLANKLCDYDRKLQLSIQYSVWDKIKDIETMNKIQISHLAQFLVHLIMEKGLPISVLKVIEFSDLNKSTVRFMRQILLAIIMNENLQTCLEVFQRISAPPKLHMFRESLRLFIQHFLVRNAGKKTTVLSDDDISALKERTQQVEKILTMHDSKLRL